MFSGIRNHRDLKKFSISRGADVFGVADVSQIKADFALPQDLKCKISRAVCLGVGLSKLILSEIRQEPTKLYFHHYRTANMFLDQLAFAVSAWIEKRGFLALAVPASQIIDWELQKAHLSHKKIARLAGAGWIGRNNLLVTKKFGSRFRMTTVLTDMSLKADQPLTLDCGECFACLEVCPVGAIAKAPEDFRHMVCFERLKSYQRQNIVGQFICGICVKACAGR